MKRFFLISIATDIWTAKTEKQTFEWQEGSLFTIPLNAAHQLFNGDGRQLALLLGCSFAPTMINLMHNEDFIFNNDFVFNDRYDGEADYFPGEGKVVGKKMLETNFIADVRAFDKLDHDPSRGYGRNVQLGWAATACRFICPNFLSGLIGKRTATSRGRIF